MERKLARIERILSIDPIPGADAIEVATVGGWKVVVKKGLYKVDSLAVYVEVDSLIPRRPWSEFLFKDTRELYRLKTIKLRGQISQGLLVPLHEIGELRGAWTEETNGGYEEGNDLTEALSIEKWEMILPANLAGKVKGNFPPFLRKTDAERLQNVKEVLTEITDIPMAVVTKVDGTSFTAYKHEGVFGVCSRNLELKQEGGDDYWAIAKLVDLPNKLPDEYAIQAELAGPGVQGNKLGLTEKQLFVFDVWDIANQRYLDREPFVEFVRSLGLETAPLIEIGFTYDQGNLPETVDEWLTWVDTLKYPNGAQIEGVVVRPVRERYSDAMRGRLSFKVISNAFLLEHKE